MSLFEDSPVHDTASNRTMWHLYLGHDGVKAANSYAAPSRAEDLSGLPPAYVLTADIDPLRDEGLQYAIALIDAAVPVELHHVPGTFHGFDAHVPLAAVSRRVLQEQVDFLRRAFAVADG
jgi:acetyl esterase/lipase